jgi:glycosyltransferase involved in cell wall biosynthesis
MITRPLRVAVVARAVMPLHGLGGLERSVRDLVRHLAARGVEVTLIVPPPRPVLPRAAADPFSVPNLTLRHVRYLTFPFANRRGTTVLDRSSAYLLYGSRAGHLAGELVQQGQVDIVHGFGASVFGYAGARRRARTVSPRERQRAGTAPLVLNPQGLEEFGATAATQPLFKRLGYAPLRRAVRRCAAAADCIIATDTALEPTVVRHLRPGPGVMRTIPNGIDLVEVSAIAGPADGQLIRQRHGIAPGEIVLLSVGRIERNKGFDILAAALARAAQPDSTMAACGWRWVIVGSGPFQPTLDKTIDAHGIRSHVLAIGRAPERDLHAWYEAATLFVHPTLYEGSSLVTLEAMAHRRPIIATRAGGLPDKVHPGENGWLVPPGDIEALAAAIGEATSQPAASPIMGTRSREIVERHFAWTAIVQRQIEVYEELLTRNRV